MSYQVLKPKHNLNDRNILPLVLEIKTTRSDDITDSAATSRLKRDHSLMDYSEEEISREFKKLTGQDVETVLSLAGKDTSPTSPTHIRYALHLAIILANSIGAPKGAVLQTSQQGGKEGGISKNAVTDVGTGAEVSTHVQDSAMEARLKKMEQQLSVSTQSQRKDKVEEALRNGSVVFPVPWTPMVITGASCCPLTNIAYSCNFPGALLSRLESPQSVIRMPATVHSRLAELERSVDSTPYNQKKSALERELLAFFDISVCNIRRISPEDICHFLIKKDGKGKTRIHSVNCPYLGRVGPSECECPSRLSAGTVQSLVGQLKSIFKVRGLGVEWDEGLCSGNPASSLRVQKYVKAIQQEQAKSHVKVSQAKPLFFGKLTKVFSHIDDLLSKVSENPAERFVLLRDQAFFKLQFFSGDRAGDLAKCLTQEIHQFEDGAGLLFGHTVGKTLNNGKVNEFTVMRMDNRCVCPVTGLEKYISGANSVGIDLRYGYLFRPLDRTRKLVLEEAVSTSSMYNRLKSYLKDMGIDEGETTHSIRGGSAVTMAVSGYGDAGDIMSHVGWSCEQSLERYTRFGKVLQRGTVSKKFRNVAEAPEWAEQVYSALGSPDATRPAFS